MVKVANHCESLGTVPGGVFWITADGNAKEIVRSLIRFSEKLTGSEIQADDKKKVELVFAILAKALSDVEGRWLLCLDNVDNANEPEVSGILSRIIHLASPSQTEGFDTSDITSWTMEYVEHSAAESTTQATAFAGCQREDPTIFNGDRNHCKYTD